MALRIGTQLGSHELTALLGKGGMGEVYRARDLKLKREVAIKILPEEFSRDSDRVSRFQREAEVLASLNHPNIAAVYDLDEDSGTRYLVLELVEGDTLADRIARGPIPVEEALTVAKQICEALEAAHERGVIHRDLKPANVKLTPEGKAKVLDFGLAKALERAPAVDGLSNSPTLISVAGTQAGVIFGTAAYMSPEQARGRNVDRRADIFAFGCVLFEMLSGRPSFEGEDVTEILGRVVTAEPDWSRLPVATPPIIRRLLRWALRKDPRQRLGDIRDARLDIEEAASEPPVVAKTENSPGQKTRSPWITAAVAIATAAVLAIPAVVHLREMPAPDAPEMHLEITTPATRTPAAFALSPDGHYIAFAASGDGAQRLWLRKLDKTGAQPLPGTDDASTPFWSADSRSIGFYASGKLKRIDIAGGVPQVLADAITPLGGAWNAQGTIIFSTGFGPLSRISASGGNPVPITRTGPTQLAHRFPNFLPDGRHFVYYSLGSTVPSIYLASLDGGEAKELTAADTTGLYLPADMLVYGKGTALLAQHLDLKRGELMGDVIRLSDFPVSTTLGEAGLSVSSDGRIAYRKGGELRGRLKWYDRSGKETGVAGEPAATAMLYPELSPDGRQVAVMLTIQSNADIWLIDLARGGMTRFTVDPATDLGAIWSSDGTRIAFASNRKGVFNLYVKPSSGVGAEEALLETPNTKFTQDWSADTRYLLYLEIDPKNGRDLWALPVTGNDRKPIPVARTAFDEQNGQFSPDGHWIAYETNESGQWQVVVQPFPDPTGKWPVSTSGGIQPRWRADGKELYFISPDGKMMAVGIAFQGSKLVPGAPVALFPVFPVAGLGANRQQYAVSHDGRFLVNQPAEVLTSEPITMILNWRPDRAGK